METNIQNLENVLNLPRNYLIVACGASQLTESLNGFSSSLYQLNIQWKASNGDSPRAEVDKQTFRLPVHADSKYVAELNAASSRADLFAAAPRGAEQSGEMNLVVKRMPDRSQWISLNAEATFEKELNMYSLLVPSYETILDQLTEKDPNWDQAIQPKHHHNIFPKFLGGRLNLENSPDYVDEHAVILLENLKLSGYENCRISLLDVSHFSAVLDRLAIFHAAGIIIRRDPKYETTLQHLLKTSRPFFFGAKDKDIELINARRRAATMNIVKKFNYSESINAKLMDVLEQTDMKTLSSPQTCYSSLLHNDLWVNNMMFQYADDSKEGEDTVEVKCKDDVKDVKFVDFQNTNFGSVAKDLVLLMYTSVHHSLWTDLETFTQYYHERLVQYLTKYFGVDFVSSYSLDKLRDELKTFACHKLKHIFHVLKLRYNGNTDLYEGHWKCVLDHCIQHNFI